jgi:transcriptional regulator with XRE-family HTH domain
LYDIAMSLDRPGRRTLSHLDIGGLVREARLLAGLSQSELARRVGTTQAVISRWERNAEVPRLDALARALRACGFEADLVFRRRDDVDRDQIVGALELTPDERLKSVTETTRLLGLAAAAR